MGWFDDIKEKANKALGLGKNNDLLRIGAAIGTGGMTELAASATGGTEGGLTDMLLGKKNITKADDIAKSINAAKSRGIGSAVKGLSRLEATLDQPADQVIKAQVEKKKQGVLTSAQDARRNAQRLMAQRGLQGTSLGLSTQRSIDQSTGQEMAKINAATPGLIRDQSLKDSQTLLNAGSGLYSNMGGQNGVQMRDQDHGRSGGILGIASSLAPIAGTVGGFMMGGPAGAAVGSQVGGGISSAFNRQQGNQYGNYA